MASDDPLVRQVVTGFERREMSSVPGVGALVSLAFKVAIDDPRRFSRSRKVGAHFGLTPREYSSGEVSYHGRIRKMGDREVRRLLYIAASRMLRRDAALWCPLKVWAVRLAQRVGIRSAGGALAVVLHTMWSDGQVFQWRRAKASASA
jgi:transposase